MARRQSQTRREVPAAVAGPRLLLLLSVLALLLVGLVMVYSASSVKAINAGDDPASFLFDQLLYAGIGIACAFVLWKFVPYGTWDRWFVWGIWAVAVALIVATFFFGKELNGAKRWLTLFGSFGIQPSEFFKVALILASAHVVNGYRQGRTPTSVLIAQIGVLLVPLLFLYKAQSDLGTTLICVVGILAALWLGEVPLRAMLGILAIVAVFAFAAMFLVGYRADRWAFLDPWNDGQGGYGSGYQIIRSYYAFAEGGLFGVGLGNSHEKFLYLFSSESDFIFAIIGEELGMVGALAVIALFLVFLYAGMRIARSAPDNFGTMVAGACVIAIAFQAFLNIGCAIGALPTTGKPLPFISSGGSSLIATFIMVGIVLSVTQAAAAPSVYDRRREDLRVVREVRPNGFQAAGQGGRVPRGGRVSARR